MPLTLYVDMVNLARIGLCNEPAGHRMVRVTLTREQEELLVQRKTGSSGGHEFYEEMRPISIQQEGE